MSKPKPPELTVRERAEAQVERLREVVIARTTQLEWAQETVMGLRRQVDEAEKMLTVAEQELREVKRCHTRRAVG